MKILYFSKNYTVHDRRFLLKLSESKHEICFLRLQENDFVYEKNAAPENIFCIPDALSKRNIASPEDVLPLIPAFEKVIEKFNPDLIHAGPVQTCAFMAALSGKAKLLSVSWGYDMLKDAFKSDYYRWVTKYALKHSDHFLCDCNEVFKNAVGISDFDEKRVTKFPWGIDLEKFYPGKGPSELREELGWQKKFVLISTRSWEKIYGITDMVQAFRQVHRKIPDARLLLLGGGSLAKELEDFISGNSLKGLVHFAGAVQNENLSEYFQASDLYVSCSATDGSSISLLEAMACGLPAVVSDIPGNREWIDDGKNGFFGSYGNADSYETAILKYFELSDLEKTVIMARNRKTAEERADWNKNFNKLLAAYEKIIS